MSARRKIERRRNLLLPYFLPDILRFLLAYKVLRVYDRCKVVLFLVLLRWAVVFYLPFYVWLAANLVTKYWGVGFGPLNRIGPLWVSFIPLPFFEASSSSALDSLFCIVVGLLWFLAGVGLLNRRVESVINCERIERRWRRACLHVGLVTHSNLGEDVKEFPEVLHAGGDTMIVNAKGFTPERVNEMRWELSQALGLVVSDVAYCKDIDGGMIPGLLQVSYGAKDLPARIPFARVPMAGELVLGFSRRGWQSVKAEDMTHALIAGTSGAGKSVALRSLLTQIMAVYPGAAVIGADFKGGSEFNCFTGLGRNFVCVTEHMEFVAALEAVYLEHSARAKALASASVDSAAELGFAPVFVVMDEAAEAFDSRAGVPKPVFERMVVLVDKLARLGRATFIRLIVATQRPTVTDGALPARVRSMLNLRVCYRCKQKDDSIAILGNGMAAKLPAIAGRGLMEKDGEIVEMQTPYLSKDGARSILSALPVCQESEIVASLRRKQMRLAA